MVWSWNGIDDGFVKDCGNRMNNEKILQLLVGNVKWLFCIDGQVLARVDGHLVGIGGVGELFELGRGETLTIVSTIRRDRDITSILDDGVFLTSGEHDEERQRTKANNEYARELEGKRELLAGSVPDKKIRLAEIDRYLEKVETMQKEKELLEEDLK